MEVLTTAKICRSATNLAPLESQREYRERLSSFIRMHTARLKALDNGISPSALPGNSMLIIAQTGCGKSYTATQLCKAAGISLITVDCSALTLSGYKGCNLGDLLSIALDQKSREEFERSIILFDEVDKMRIDGAIGNPQANFLKLFDGLIQAETKGRTPEIIDVSRMSFLFAGAFSGLEEVIRRRLTPRSIGFSVSAHGGEKQKDLLSLATMADIREYGFMEELLGRIGSLVYVPPFTLADYRTLLKGTSGSVCSKYSNLLGTSGVTLDISDNACARIARQAGESALGARAVDPIIYDCLQGAFAALDGDDTINRVTIACRQDHLTLRFGHGAREYSAAIEKSGDAAPEAEPESETTKLPDVSIARYLQSDEGVRELMDIALEVFGRPDTDDEKRLRVFLRCCLCLMRGLKCEEDLVLSSVTKLADATKPDGEKDSCFDRIVNAELEYRKLPNEERNKLFEAYLDYCKFKSEENHRFWVSASKELRRKWYRKLLLQAG